MAPTKATTAKLRKAAPTSTPATTKPKPATKPLATSTTTKPVLSTKKPTKKQAPPPPPPAPTTQLPTHSHKIIWSRQLVRYTIILHALSDANKINYEPTAQRFHLDTLKANKKYLLDAAYPGDLTVTLAEEPACEVTYHGKDAHVQCELKVADWGKLQSKYDSVIASKAERRSMIQAKIQAKANTSIANKQSTQFYFGVHPTKPTDDESKAEDVQSEADEEIEAEVSKPLPKQKRQRQPTPIEADDDDAVDTNIQSADDAEQIEEEEDAGAEPAKPERKRKKYVDQQSALSMIDELAGEHAAKDSQSLKNEAQKLARLAAKRQAAEERREARLRLKDQQVQKATQIQSKLKKAKHADNPSTERPSRPSTSKSVRFTK